MSFKSFLKRILPHKIKNLLIKLYGLKLTYTDNRKIKQVRENQTGIVKDLKENNNIKIAFFLLNVDTWKLDSLYWSFQNHPRFEPIVIICPFIGKGDDFMKSELKKGIDYCTLKKYNHFEAYNELKAKDVKSIIKPDIVFFTNPNRLTFDALLIDNYLNKLTCYVPYSFRIDTLYEYEFNSRMVNLTWLNFYESNIHRKLAKKYADNRGENVIVTGFPFLDGYKNNNNKNENGVWKTFNKNIKRIIWAPHWTIKGFQNTGLDWSCFLEYHQLILDLAREFKDEIQFALKPHPFLKKILADESLWGIEKTNKYFDEWRRLDNCQYINGDYIELFKESDALIHDSGSFMTEYLALNKPVAYTISENSIDDRFNEFGQKVLKGHELINSKNELRGFILDLLNNEDKLKGKREEIIIENNLQSSELISNKIVEIINNKIS